MTPAGSVGLDATLRLFLALRLSDGIAEVLKHWAAAHVASSNPGCHIRLVRRADLHVTLAFLGQRPRSDVEEVVAALRAAALPACGIALRPVCWRETRSVGMVELHDETGAARALVDDLRARLEALGVARPERRPWLAHVTVARWRRPPRLDPPLPPVGTLVPSEAAAYISRLHPSGARYEVLEAVALARETLDPPEKPVGGVTP